MRVNATIRDGHDVDEVAERLTRSGMRVDQKLADLGIVTGEVADDQLEKLGKLDGVAAVEPDGDVQLPPPTSPIQ